MKPANLLVPEYPEAATLPQRLSDPVELREVYSQYLHDESKLVGGPISALWFPRSVEDISAVLQANFAAGVPTSVSSARTGLTGGGVPHADANLLSTAKMQTIADLVSGDGERKFVRVQAGVSLQVLNDRVRELIPGYFFPIDPTETSASFAGMCATNASGARSFKYGSVRKWVRGLTVVLADGGVLRLTRGEHHAVDGVFELQARNEKRVLQAAELGIGRNKSTIGYLFSKSVDAVDLFIGSEGTLGVIAEIDLILVPVPEPRLGFLQFFDDADNALTFVSRVRDEASLAPLAIEYFDAHSLRLLKEKATATSKAIAQIPESSMAAVYAELLLPNDDAVIEVFETLGTLVSELDGDIELSVAGTEERDLRDLKIFRHAVPETCNAIIAQRKLSHPTIHKLSTDMAVADQHLREVFYLYKDSLDAMGLEYAIFGHVGDNHFHVNILPRDEQELLLAKEQYLKFAKRIVAMGGVVSAEHGIGRIKRDFLRIQYPDAVISEMEKIKRFFDPTLLLNPGVLLS